MDSRLSGRLGLGRGLRVIATSREIAALDGFDG